MKWLVLSFALHVFIALPLSSQDCTDMLVHNGTEVVEAFDIDTTGHWWAIVRPYESMVVLIVDGDRYGPYNRVARPTFSPDGSSWVTHTELNGELKILSPQYIQLPQCNGVLAILYPQNSTQPWFRILVAEQIVHTNGIVQFSAINPTGQWATDPSGSVLYHVATRGSLQALVRNDREIATADEILLGGVWVDGRPVFAARNGEVWTLFLGVEEVRTNLRNVRSLSVNITATVLGGVVSTPLGEQAIMYSEEYTEPWLGPLVDGISFYALSPFAFLCVWEGSARGVKSVYYNTAPYPAGRSRGPIVFSHDGSVMGFIGSDDDDFVTIDGRRTMMNRRLSKDVVPALHPSGESIAYSTGSSLAVWNISDKSFRLGRICDRVGKTIYNWRRGVFTTIGTFGERLFILECNP